MQSRAIIEEVEKTAGNINLTAKSNNRYSRMRKDMTDEALDALSRVFNDNTGLRDDFGNLFTNIRTIASDVAVGIDIIIADGVQFEEVVEKITIVKKIFFDMNEEIDALTKIVETIKNNTDEIFSLALNASIVSSKYTHTSGVFDIIANKLNEMSTFIGENLKGIINVVDPITEGLAQLIDGNSEIIEKTNEGYESLKTFTKSLEEKKEVATMVYSLKSDMDGATNNQLKMLNNLKNQLTQMSYDSDEAIKGSGNNVGWTEQLMVFALDAKGIMRSKTKEKDGINHLKKKLLDIKEIAHSIFLAGSTVHTKSKTQLEFSKNSISFCDTIIEESNTLVGQVTEIQTQGRAFDEAMKKVVDEMKEVTDEIQDIIRMFRNDQAMMDKFNQDYAEIDNIIGFLRNIMKSMNLIGMLSRIESSREPEEYVQFMTISENIRALQTQIHDNIPIIESNVDRTQTLIDDIKTYFEEIFLNFSTIDQSIVSVNNSILHSIETSEEAQRLLAQIANESENISTNLAGIRHSVDQMLETITHPIEGGAFNRDNANRIEIMCDNLINEAVI